MSSEFVWAESSHRPGWWGPVLSSLLLTVMVVQTVRGAEDRPVAEVERVLAVDEVWAGHPVGFALLTHGKHQFVAYYDAERRMTLAHRKLGSDEWAYKTLPRQTGWDSHNYITLAVDRKDHLHVAGDMHVDPLRYFRSKKPLDIQSVERVEHMVGPERERRVTYPKFIRGANDELIFRYRDGSSGKGDDLYNVYDPETGEWERLVDGAIVSGEGEMNAYCTLPKLGPDGYFHMTWVWRDTPDAATNHDLSYARSPDLKHWQRSDGTELDLPITFDRAEIVDPVPAGGGIINGNTKLGFDNDGRVILTYHKYDDAGDTQIYAARREEAGWEIYQVSDWEDYRWDFGGGGSLGFEVRVGSVRPLGDGRLALGYRYGRGSGTWVLDGATLEPTGEPAPPPERARPPRSVRRVESDFEGMRKKMTRDDGEAPEAGVRYILTWETLGPNRDRPREGPVPKPSTLKLIKLRDGSGE